MNAMTDNFSENLAKPCQKADQPAQVTETAVATAAANGGPARLKPSQERALGALVECRSIAAAARKAQVGDRTLRRWLHEDVRFQTRLRQLSQESLAHARLRLHTGASDAVEMMFALIKSPERVESGRATLVRTALDFAFRSGAYSDLTGRIAALEAASKEKERPELVGRAALPASRIRQPGCRSWRGAGRTIPTPSPGSRTAPFTVTIGRSGRRPLKSSYEAGRTTPRCRGFLWIANSVRMSEPPGPPLG